MVSCCLIIRRQDVPDVVGIAAVWILVACVVSPNFKDSELCSYYKTKDPTDVPARMLTAGEYGRLIKAVNRINGFTVDEAETLEEEAKN